MNEATNQETSVDLRYSSRIMSGFENYPHELADLDRQIRHYAAMCQFDLANRSEVEACMFGESTSPTGNPAFATLRGLLVLRTKIETEMIEEGMSPPPLASTPDPAP